MKKRRRAAAGTDPKLDGILTNASGPSAMEEPISGAAAASALGRAGRAVARAKPSRRSKMTSIKKRDAEVKRSRKNG